jgi:crotonobetaine/carnitine-CoA ligase
MPQSMLRDRTIAQMVRAQAARHGERPFLVFEGRRWSYVEFDRVTDQVACGLRRLGVRAGTHVAVLMENKPEAWFVYFALGKLGAVGVAINVAMKGALLKYFLENSDSTHLIADAGLLERVDQVLGELPKLQDIVRYGDGMSHLQGRAVQDFAVLMQGAAAPVDGGSVLSDLFLILYTSGTTGPSKGVLSTHCHAITVGVEMAAGFGYREDDVLYVCLPLFHASALLNSAMAALMVGATIVLARRFSVSQFWSDVRAHDVTLLMLLGAMADFIWNAPPDARDRQHKVRQCVVVPVPRHNYDAFEARFGLKLATLYGITDVSLVSTRSIEEKPEYRFSVGRPRPHFEVKILDPDDFELPLGTAGEICVRPLQPWVSAPGYYNMPEATTRAIRNLWFHTGDRGTMDAAGYLYFIDRIKDSIRRRGENISSYEIEQIVCRHPAVLEAAAFAVRAEHAEDEVMLSVVAKAGAELDERGIVEFCRQAMPYFMVPRFVALVAQLPKTETQKIEKYKLRAVAEADLARVWDRDKAGIKIEK